MAILLKCVCVFRKTSGKNQWKFSDLKHYWQTNELFIEYTSFPFIPIKKDFRWGPGRISSMSYVFSQMAKMMVHFCILFVP
jgi:hypothetical protein